MAHATNFLIHDVDDITARVDRSDGCSWLTLKLDGGKGGKFEVVAFMDFDAAQRFADAINMAAHNTPEPTADPVITWERPSYHRQATGARSKRRCAECGMYEATDDAPMCEPCRDYVRAVQPTGQVLR